MRRQNFCSGLLELVNNRAKSSHPLKNGTMDVEPVNCARNLGAWFDSMFVYGKSCTKYAVLDSIICIISEGLENADLKTV